MKNNFSHLDYLKAKHFLKRVEVDLQEQFSISVNHLENTKDDTLVCLDGSTQDTVLNSTNNSTDFNSGEIAIIYASIKTEDDFIAEFYMYNYYCEVRPYRSEKTYHITDIEKSLCIFAHQGLIRSDWSHEEIIKDLKEKLFAIKSNATELVK